MAKITKADQTAIQVLVKYPEYKVLEKLLKQYVEELKDLTTIGLPRLTIPEEVAGRLWAYKSIQAFFAEIELVKIEAKPKADQTYN